MRLVPAPVTPVLASARAELEEFELAAARLEWVRAAGCLHLPAQRQAVEWHQACFAAALEANDPRRHDGGAA